MAETPRVRVHPDPRRNAEHVHALVGPPVPVRRGRPGAAHARGGLRNGPPLQARREQRARAGAARNARRLPADSRGPEMIPITRPELPPLADYVKLLEQVWSSRM